MMVMKQIHLQIGRSADYFNMNVLIDDPQHGHKGNPSRSKSEIERSLFEVLGPDHPDQNR